MRLEKYIKDNKIDREDLASDLGVTVAAVSLWILGKRVPRKAMIGKIEAVTNGKVKARDFY